MSIICSQCSYENPDQSGFCVRCGTRLQPTAQPVSSTIPAYSPATAAAPPTAAASYSPPTYAQPPITQVPFPQQSWAPNSAPPAAYPPPAQMGTGQGLASIRRAFAGRGTLITHHSWQLDGKQKDAASLLTAVNDMFHQRNYIGLIVKPERLTERNLLLEERDYLAVRRGNATAFIYVAPASNDLYISRATTVFTPISQVRVAVLVLLLLIAIFGLIIGQNIASNILTSGLAGLQFAGLLTLVSYCIWLFFIWLLICSFSSLLVEKDFWQYLRPNVLNDFQMDDIALLEHSTDQVMRDTVQQLGLDASKINPPPQGYQPKRKIRII